MRPIPEAFLAAAVAGAVLGMLLVWRWRPRLAAAWLGIGGLLLMAFSGSLVAGAILARLAGADWRLGLAAGVGFGAGWMAFRQGVERW